MVQKQQGFGMIPMGHNDSHQEVKRVDRRCLLFTASLLRTRKGDTESFLRGGRKGEFCREPEIRWFHTLSRNPLSEDMSTLIYIRKKLRKKDSPYRRER